MTLGAEREIFTGVSLALDLVHRKFSNQYEVNETNRIWTARQPPEHPGRYRNGRAETINDWDPGRRVRRTTGHHRSEQA